jgi:hypothetical protein
VNFPFSCSSEALAHCGSFWRRELQIASPRISQLSLFPTALHDPFVTMRIRPKQQMA